MFFKTKFSLFSLIVSMGKPLYWKHPVLPVTEQFGDPAVNWADSEFSLLLYWLLPFLTLGFLTYKTLCCSLPNIFVGFVLV